MTKIHFRSYIHKKMILFPQRIDKDIAEDDPVRLLDALVDNLMLDNVYKLYKPSGRKPYHPQMMLSWYNLGNDVLFMLVDSKYNTSLYYHIPFINNKKRGKRGQDGFGHGNTYQTYIWLETKKDIKQKMISI